MSSVLIFGDQMFVDEFLQGGLNVSVVGIAHDMVTAANHLKSFEADNVITGFDEQFVWEMADLYRNKRFFWVLSKDNITADIYRKALSRGIQVVKRGGAKEVIASEIAMHVNSPSYERRPVDNNIALQLESDMIAKKSRTLKSHTLAITGIKGGIGKTTVATSLAAYIAKWAKTEKIDYKVCLVDCDAEGARSAGIWLGIAKAPQSLSVWANLEHDPSWMELEQLLIYHEESGLHILPGPQTFQDAFSTKLTTSLAERIIGALRWHFDLIVLDLGSFVNNETAIRAMQIASKVFVVIEPTLTVLKLMEDMIEENTLGRLKVDLSRVRLVLNAYDGLFSQDNIRRTLNIPIAGVLPVDKNVRKVENSAICQPPTIAIPNCAFSRGISNLARGVVDNELLPVIKKPSLLNPKEGINYLKNYLTDRKKERQKDKGLKDAYN